MKRLAIALAVLQLAGSGCSDSPLRASAVGPPTIDALSPASGPIGTHVRVQGAGFSASDNTITFGANGIEPPVMPRAPGVVPRVSSPDGTTIAFDVPGIWRPACSFPPEACPFAQIATAVGVYGVTVTNSSGASNVLTFTVTP